MTDPIQLAAIAMAKRLRMFKRLAEQSRERGTSNVSLHVNEVWEPADQEALDQFEIAMEGVYGTTPKLPLES